MQQRNANVGDEDLNSALGPLFGLFLRFNNQPATYSLRESLEEVRAACVSGNINIHPQELDRMIDFCEDKGRDMVTLAGEDKSVAEIAALALYTTEFYAQSSVYGELNRLLRSKNRQELKPFVRYIWLLMWGLRKAPAFPGRMIYRGVKLNLSREYQDRCDRTVIWHQFSSCTCNVAVQNSDQFMGSQGERTLFSIELTTNRGRQVQEYSLLPDEQEVLLPPNSVFSVRGVFNAGNGLTMVQLLEEPPRDPILDFPVPPPPIPAPAPAPAPVCTLLTLLPFYSPNFENTLLYDFFFLPR